jgi:hypothetical protein
LDLRLRISDFCRARHALLVLTLLLAAAASVRAEEKNDWTLTTSDLHSDRVALKSIDTSGIRTADRTVGFDQFLQIDRVTNARAATGPLTLCLVDGQRVAGDAIDIAGDSLKWKSPVIGEMRVPVRTVSAVVRAGMPLVEPPAEARTEDLLQLGNGDQIRGIISDVTPQAISIQPSSGGDATAVPMDSIIAAYFAKKASGAATQPSQDRAFRVTLFDDSRVTARSIALDRDTLRLTLDDNSTRELKMSSVRGIEQLNGPVIWLSSLAPMDEVQTPYFGGASQPARMDRTVTGEPIRFNGRDYSRGIGVHSYSRLVFRIDPAFATSGIFRTQYAIDGDQPWADVTVRIKVNDRVAYEKASVKSDAISPVVQLDLSAARTITLEVDYGANYDVQDRFNWIEPALLRTKPVATATMPATAP